jgi:hypothetical protein
MRLRFPENSGLGKKINRDVSNMICVCKQVKHASQSSDLRV